MSVLICGGAGYIGSHNVRALLDRGESVVVLDNLWTGHRAALPGSVPFYEGDVRDAALLDKIMGEHPVEANLFTLLLEFLKASLGTYLLGSSHKEL